MKKDYSKIFNHPMFGEVRTVVNGDEIWFCLVDVCGALGLQTYHVKERLDDDLVSNHPISDALGRTQQANFVNEEGLYEVIFQSRKPIAKDFRKWVMSEVLPSIRKYGVYMTDETLQKSMEDPLYLTALVEVLKQENEEMKQENEEMKKKNEEMKQENNVLSNKARHIDLILGSKDAIDVTQIAQDYGMSAISFNKLLNDMGIQYKVGEQWILRAGYRECGYAVSYTHYHVGSDGEPHTKLITKWTQKGRLMLRNKLAGEGIFPTIEQVG